MAVDSPAARPGGGPAMVPPFDQVAVGVAPGSDLVVRMPGLLLVVAVDQTATAPAQPQRLGGWGATAQAPAQPPAPAGNVRVGDLIALCRRLSAAGSRAPGRRLHDELKSWLPTAGDLPSFALAAATEEGLAIALLGDGTAEVPDLGLRLTPADGERLGSGRLFLDRLVEWPPAALRLSAGSTPDAAPHPLADLQAGAVPGAAAVLAPAPAPSPVRPPEGPPPTQVVRVPAFGQTAPAATPPVAAAPAGAPPPVPPSRRASTKPTPDRDHAGHDHAGHDHAGHDHAGHDHAGHDHPPAPAPVPVPETELPPPVLSASLLDDEEDEVRAPLPVLSTEQPPAALIEEPEDGRPKVKGFLCSRGHLNDPRALFCNLCGIRMAERTGVFIEGVRPPLGLLVFDNGATVSLDADYLVGREPETDERVRGGALRPLLVVDQTGGVSRHHAEIHLDGWDVLLHDTGSANGTLVAPQGAPAWASLVPGQPVRLTPGMAVRMGSRQFAFESPHGSL